MVPLARPRGARQAGAGAEAGPGAGAGKMSTRDATRMMVDAVLTPMQNFKAHLGLQRWGCLALVALLEVRPDDESMVATIVASGGISALLGAMALMKDDEDVQAAGCGVLGNSQIFDPSIVRLNGTASIVAVLSAMDAFPRCRLLYQTHHRRHPAPSPPPRTIAATPHHPHRAHRAHRAHRPCYHHPHHSRYLHHPAPSRTIPHHPHHPTYLPLHHLTYLPLYQVGASEWVG